MTFTDEQQRKLAVAQEILGYRFADEQLLLSAITHPSATEGKSVKYSYERLEFLGDSILGAIVATIAFDRFHDLDEGGLTRIKVALVSGASLSDVAERLGFADVIVFGSSETGTGRRRALPPFARLYQIRRFARCEPWSARRSSPPARWTSRAPPEARPSRPEEGRRRTYRGSPAP